MNRFTIAIICVLILVLIGTSMYWTNKFKHLKEKEFDTIKTEITIIKADKQKTIDGDSIMSMIESVMLEKQDSLISIYDDKYRKLQNLYKYELKRRDERIEARLDSLTRIKPALPDF